MSNEDAAAKRAHWLAELASALDDARHVVKELGVGGDRIDAVELYTRIEAARVEVQAIRVRRASAGRDNIDPKWINDIPWKRSA